MASYERLTALKVADILHLAEELYTARLPLQKVRQDGHSITLSGGDGTVTVSAHSHGLDTEVRAVTDQLRTSRLDTETSYFLSRLPYQPQDQATR
jgi:hypothetical protein